MFAHRNPTRGIRQQFRDCGFGECFFHETESTVNAFVKGAEVQGMAVEMERAELHARKWIDGRNDIEYGNLIGNPGERKSAVHAALTAYKSTSIKGL